jgi:hypothetical protein
MVPFIEDKFALLVPLAILALAKESVCTSKVLRALAIRIVKAKKPFSEID